jgi:hypothetical protein
MDEPLIFRALVDDVRALTELSHSVRADSRRIVATSRAARATAQRVRQAARDDRRRRLGQRHAIHR